jgi:hypothetical protein
MMEKPHEPHSTLVCYLAAIRNDRIDPELHRRGFCKGMLIFAIPSLGVQYKCRAEGQLVDLEFAALFTLLRFIKSKLKEEGIKRVKVISSNPEFVFSFTGNSKHLTKNSKRWFNLARCKKDLNLAVGFIEPAMNRAFVSPADYPSIPRAVKPIIQPDQFDNEPRFKQFQRGIRL